MQWFMQEVQAGARRFQPYVIRTHSCVYAYMHTHAHAQTYSCVHVRIHVYMYACIHLTYLHACIHLTYLHGCVNITRIYISMYGMYLFIHALDISVYLTMCKTFVYTKHKTSVDLSMRKTFVHSIHSIHRRSQGIQYT